MKRKKPTRIRKPSTRINWTLCRDKLPSRAGTFLVACTHGVDGKEWVEVQDFFSVDGVAQFWNPHEVFAWADLEDLAAPVAIK